MTVSGPNQQHLAALAASELQEQLAPRSVGDSLAIGPGSKLCDILELLIPIWLRAKYPEWEPESIDGFLFSTVRKSGEFSAALRGTCILISDQSMTPFSADLCIEDGQTLRPVQVRIGEAGGGPLGISGPKYGSTKAKELLLDLESRIADIQWEYEISGDSCLRA